MDFREWIGRTETVSDVVTPTPYAALSATFDRPAERPAPGTPLPALWHWLPEPRVSHGSQDGDWVTSKSLPRGNGR